VGGAGHVVGLPRRSRMSGSVCVCFYLTSGFTWPYRPRDAGPGADHRTGRAELPIYIHIKIHVLYIYVVTPPYTLPVVS
jgi:hypothetical protein